jgi:hypothetical protein
MRPHVPFELTPILINGTVPAKRRKAGASVCNVDTTAGIQTTMGAFTYPRSEPGSGGHLDLVERLNAFPNALRQELAGVSQTGTARAGDGSWSINDVLGHLCDHARFFHERIWRIINLEEPRLAGYDEQALAQERNAQSASISDLVAEFSAHRAATVELLSELVHWNWARAGRHEQLGRISIRQLVDRAIAHDANHLAQIRRLRAAAPA